MISPIAGRFSLPVTIRPSDVPCTHKMINGSHTGLCMKNPVRNQNYQLKFEIISSNQGQKRFRIRYFNTFQKTSFYTLQLSSQK